MGRKHQRTGDGVALGGTKGYRAVDIFGGAVHPGALGAVEGQLLAVHGVKILAEETPGVLEDIAEAANHRVIAPDGVLGLAHVDHVEDKCNNHHPHQHQKHQGGENLQQQQQDGQAVFHRGSTLFVI